MDRAHPTTLLVALGDIHGRFERVSRWIDALERARGRPADLVVAVGDVEAFVDPSAPGRKSTKLGMPAEFASFTATRAFYFIGGNNEDFDALHDAADGTELAAGVTYLGRVGARTVAGLRIAYLSGIHAPRFLDAPRVTPHDAGTRKQAGYFRRADLAVPKPPADVMLVHEWPRGIVSRGAVARHAKGRALRALRFPWVGNGETRAVVDRVQPAWLLCGHSHVAFATSLSHGSGAVTRIACLDQAARPEGSVFWIEFDGARAMHAGWGIDGAVTWSDGQPWNESRTPAAGDADPTEGAATRRRMGRKG